MFNVLLAVIYVSFISLGLPDALLGSAWPSIYAQISVPISFAGIVSMTISGGTIISSLLSDKLIRRFGTGKVTAVSVGMTAIALFGFSISTSFWMLIAWAIPYGLGAGSVDVALNNFVALHYKARHMSWLHCFWGIGASLGPYIMGFCLTRGLNWNSGYRFIFILQAALTIVLIFSIPLWRRQNSNISTSKASTKSINLRNLIKIRGAKPALAAFFCYCAIETTAGLWGSSYMVIKKGVHPDTAAKWISLFYIGITIGRFISGFITMKINDKNMVRLGQALTLIGVIILILPLNNISICVGFLFIGIGCAPIYPCLLHSTPNNFGKEASQSIMGMQMACAYIGSTFMPPIVGFVIENISITLYPIIMALIVLSMIILTERLNITTKSVNM